MLAKGCTKQGQHDKCPCNQTALHPYTNQRHQHHLVRWTPLSWRTVVYFIYRKIPHFFQLSHAHPPFISAQILLLYLHAFYDPLRCFITVYTHTLEHWEHSRAENRKQMIGFTPPPRRVTCVNQTGHWKRTPPSVSLFAQQTHWKTKTHTTVLFHVWLSISVNAKKIGPQALVFGGISLSKSNSFAPDPYLRSNLSWVGKHAWGEDFGDSFIFTTPLDTITAPAKRPIWSGKCAFFRSFPVRNSTAKPTHREVDTGKGVCCSLHTIFIDFALVFPPSSRCPWALHASHKVVWFMPQELTRAPGTNSWFCLLDFLSFGHTFSNATSGDGIFIAAWMLCTKRHYRRKSSPNLKWRAFLFQQSNNIHICGLINLRFRSFESFDCKSKKNIFIFESQTTNNSLERSHTRLTRRNKIKRNTTVVQKSLHAQNPTTPLETARGPLAEQQTITITRGHPNKAAQGWMRMCTVRCEPFAHGAGQSFEEPMIKGNYHNGN